MTNHQSNQNNVIIGTGPLGLWVMDALLARGREVTLVNRSGRISETLPDGVLLKTADCTDPAQVRQVCSNADVVFMCGMPPYTDWPDKFPPLMRGLITGLNGTGVKFVFGDNLYMYGDTKGQPIHEGMPYVAATRKGKTRAEMAQWLLDAHKTGKFNVTIGRASDFYGPRVRNTLIGEMFFDAALNGKTANVLGNIDSDLIPNLTIAAIVPLIIAPFMSYLFVGLLAQMDKAEQENAKLVIELQNALATAKTLSGLLPICATCKKIRDDAGYWHQVEVYIRDHSEVDFSHGLCPDCIQEMQDQIAKVKKNMRQVSLKG